MQKNCREEGTRRSRKVREKDRDFGCRDVKSATSRLDIIVNKDLSFWSIFNC